MQDPGAEITLTWNSQQLYNDDQAIWGQEGNAFGGTGGHIQKWFQMCLIELWNGSGSVWNLTDVVFFITRDTPKFTGALVNSFRQELRLGSGQLFDPNLDPYQHEPWVPYSDGIALNSAKITLQYRSPYARPVEYGSSPHTPPFQKLYGWVSGKIASGVWTGDPIKKTWALQNWIKKNGTYSSRMIHSNVIPIWSLSQNITIAAGNVYGYPVPEHNGYYSAGIMNVSAEVITPGAYTEQGRR